MGKFIDLTGMKFGRWTVDSCAHRAMKLPGGGKTHTLWNVTCDCGAVSKVRSDGLLSGKSTSCGCFHSEVTSKRGTVHGLSQSGEYNVWAAMWQRCENPDHPHFYRYGGRGIIVDPHWRKFADFYSDMGPRPSSDHSIERVDNDGPYAKWNCSWELQSVQANNTCNTVRVAFRGRVQSITQWCRELNLNYSVVQDRLKRKHMSFEDALSLPTRAPFKEKVR